MSEEVDDELVELIAEHYDIEIKQLTRFEELQEIYVQMRGDSV